ncbi:hypothetical protein HD806DRAFT_495628 [Xylariaceae sp. AK1471]|nr:hypothetical protein HD806DRAFT_495628 [Xylariaceae sp. AK1471]
MGSEDSMVTQLYALSVVFGLLPFVAVGLRLQVRRMTKAYVGLDDWLILFALVGATTTAVLLLIDVAAGGAGRPLKRDSDGNPIYDDTYVLFQKVTWALGFSQILAIGLTKLSVLLFYRRIFSIRDRRFNIISFSLIVLATLWTIAFFITNILESFPVYTEWARNPDDQRGNMDITTMFLSQCYTDVALDVLIIVLPIPLIWKLHMDLKKKLLISCIFLLGAVTTASSIARTVVQYRVAREYRTGNVDKTYYLSPGFYWPVIESSLGIVGACLPMLGPLGSVYSMEKIWLNPKHAVTSVYLRILQSFRNSSEEKLSEAHVADTERYYQDNKRPSESDKWEAQYNLSILNKTEISAQSQADPKRTSTYL